jgi:hypothetical protein
MTIVPMCTSSNPLRRFLAALVLSAPALCGAQARADDAASLKLVLFDVRFFDTSQEPRDQSAEHAARAAAASERIKAAVDDTPNLKALRPRAEICAAATVECLMDQAKAAGGQAVLTIVVQKSSSLIMQAWARVTQIGTGKTLFARDLSFRGDTDESWDRAFSHLARDLSSQRAQGGWTDATSGEAAKVTAPVKLAIFPFELVDFTAAGGTAAAPDESPWLTQSTEAAKRGLARSGLYAPLDAVVDQKQAAPDCDGCEARLATGLGADQSMRGVVTKLSMTEYRLQMQFRDARTGKVVGSYATDMRVGADYSWPRAVGWLLENKVLASRR